MSDWIQGKIVARRQWTDKLISLQVEAKILPFTAGQFAKLALDIDGDRISRPYSFVNAPAETPLEFYFIIVPDGSLSARLGALDAGDTLWIDRKASGFFTLDEIPQGDILWCLSTGTGLGVFISLLATELPWQRFKKIILVHAVRTCADLSYQDKLAHFAATHPTQFQMIPVVSREKTSFSLTGRIPDLIDNGALENRAGILLEQDTAQVMICGNPAMAKECCVVLEKRGLKKNLRKSPGQITTENYWRAS